MEAAKALGGSFKLGPKTAREMTQLLSEHKKMGTNESKSTNELTKHKPRLNTQKTHSAQPGCINWSW